MWRFVFEKMVRGLFRTGALEISFPDGTVSLLGDGTEPVRVTLTDPTLLRKFVLRPEMTLGEAYTDGSFVIENDDLEGFLNLATRNKTADRTIWWRTASARVDRMINQIQQINPTGRSQRNVAHHYDLSGELYDLFLDADRQYSCAYFETGSETLEAAQAAKKRMIANKLCLSPGQRVLDIGCGWGGMALTLAREHDVSVVGVTLSREQYDVARARVTDAGLEDRIEIRLADYRSIQDTFDRIVSVGMFEHVGAPQYGTYFGTVRDLLTEDGIALIHTIGRTAPPRSASPWVRKYIFPGGYVPSMSEVTRAIENAGLWMTDIEILRLHYAETLRHWIERFEANEEKARDLYDERFCRMWRFYLVACEATFRHGWQGVFQFQISHKLDAVPLTRHYLYEQDTSKQQIAAQ